MLSRVATLTLTCVLVVTLSGCADDDPSTDPRPSQDATSASSDASTSATPEVVPADGPLLEANALSLHLYDSPDWQTTTVGSTASAGLRNKAGSLTITLTDLETDATDLDEDAEAVLDVMSGDKLPPRRAENRVINRVECWVLAGENQDRRIYLVGGIHAGYEFTIEFNLPAGWGEADKRIEEILASIDWQ